MFMVVQHIAMQKAGPPPRVVDIQNLKLVLETLESSRRHPFRQGNDLGWGWGVVDVQRRCTIYVAEYCSQ